MKKKKIDRAALEAHLSQIEQSKPILPPLRLMAYMALLAILAMAFQSCKHTTICEDIRNPKNYSGYK